MRQMRTLNISQEEEWSFGELLPIVAVIGVNWKTEDDPRVL